MSAVHHYVPRFYLKYFSSDENKNSIWAYQRNKDPFSTNVRNVAGETDFYIFEDSRTGKKSDELEKVYAQLESEAKGVIDNLSQLGLVKLSKEDHGNLAYFISNLHVRGLSHRQMTANSFGAMQKLMAQFGATNKDYFYKGLKDAGMDMSEERMEELRQFALSGEFEVKFNPRDSYFLKSALQMEQEIYPYIAAKDIYHVKTNSKMVLVTSDNPVSVIKSSNTHPLRGGGIIDGIITLPISPTSCLVLKNPGSPSLEDELFTEQIKVINGQTMFNAHRYLFSNLKSKDIAEVFNRTEEGAGQKIQISSPFGDMRGRA